MAASRKATALAKRHEALLAEKRLWEPVWQELAEFIQPRKSNILLKRSPGQRQTERLFDSTGFEANELLAATMHGSLTSQSLPWFLFTIEGLRLGDIPEIDQWLEVSTKVVHRAVGQSNYNSEAFELYSDLSCFGTAPMFMDEHLPLPGQRFGGLRFLTLTPGSYAISEDKDGFVDTLFVEHQMTPVQLQQMFGDRISDVMAKRVTTHPHDRFTIVHGVYPRPEVGQVDSKVIVPATKMPWGSTWYEQETLFVNKESGFMEFPYLVPRWTKTSGETYGRGPAYIALPDVATLNKVVELKLRAMAKIVNPPIVARDGGVVGNLQLTSGGVTWVRDMDMVKTMDLKIDLERTNIEIERLQERIRRIFYSNQLQLQEGPQMTAYEVQVRYELMQRTLGPTLGRLEAEYLSRLVVRAFWMLYRRGMLPPMPPALVAFLNDGGRLDIRYEGPLARAQRLSETVAAQRFLQFAMPLIQMDPSSADYLRVGTMLRDTGKNIGLSPNMLRTDEEVDTIRAQRQAEQQAAQEQANALQMAEGLGKVAPAIKSMGEAVPPAITVPGR